MHVVSERPGFESVGIPGDLTRRLVDGLPFRLTGAQRRVLAEILADPASDWNDDGELHFRDDEWVEIRNTGPDIVLLSGYFLRDGLGEDPHLELDGVLAHRT